MGAYAVTPPPRKADDRFDDWMIRLRTDATPQFGTWTPVLTFATPGDLSVSYTSRDGSYIKIGKLVIANFFIVTSAFTYTTASGQLRVTGCPYKADSSVSSGVSSGQFAGVTKTNYTAFIGQINSSGIFSITACGSGQSAASLTTTDVPSAGSIRLFYTIPFIAA